MFRNLCIVVFLLATSAQGAIAATRIILPAKLNAIDTRGDYYIELLRKSLQVTENAYGPFQIVFTKKIRVQKRVLRDLAEGNSEITLTFSGATTERDNLLLPIRIPLAKGMLGYRVFIISDNNREYFLSANSKSDLKAKVACQGVGWPDTDILRSGGLNVETSYSYESLFKMVSFGRCDYFPRAIHEPYLELEARKDEYPNLIVENTWLIHYPFPTYYYLNKDDVKLATRIEEGLRILLNTGEFENHMRDHPATSKAYKLLHHMKDRKILELENASLHPDTPLNDPNLWIKLN